MTNEMREAAAAWETAVSEAGWNGGVSLDTAHGKLTRLTHYSFDDRKFVEWLHREDGEWRDGQ